MAKGSAGLNRAGRTNAAGRRAGLLSPTTAGGLGRRRTAAGRTPNTANVAATRGNLARRRPRVAGR